MSNSEAIINFMYFGHNYPHDFISKVWGDDSSMSQHLADKFSSMYSEYGTMTIFRWFMELDHINKNILLDWISDNYKN